MILTDVMPLAEHTQNNWGRELRRHQSQGLDLRFGNNFTGYNYYPGPGQW